MLCKLIEDFFFFFYIISRVSRLQCIVSGNVLWLSLSLPCPKYSRWQLSDPWLPSRVRSHHCFQPPGSHTLGLNTLPDIDTLYNTILLYITRKCQTSQHCFTLHYQTVQHFTTLFYSKLPDSATLNNTILLYITKQQKTFQHYLTIHYQKVPNFTTLFYSTLQIVQHFTTLFYSKLPGSATLNKNISLYTTRQCHTLQNCFNLHYQTVPHFTSILPNCDTLYNTNYSTLQDIATIYSTALLYTTRKWHTFQHCFTLHYQKVPHFTTQFYSKLPNSETLYKPIYSKLQDSASFYNTVLLYSTLPDSGTLSSTLLLFTTRKCNNLNRRFTLYYYTVPHFITPFYSTLPNRDTIYNNIYSTLQDSATFYTTKQWHTLQHYYFTLQESATFYITVLLCTTR